MCVLAYLRSLEDDTLKSTVFRNVRNNIVSICYSISNMIINWRMRVYGNVISRILKNIRSPISKQ